MEEKLNSGSEPFNKLLEGGFEKGVLTTIFGPASTGKTTACLLASIQTDKKVIFIDTEGGFSVERLKQLAENPGKVLDNLLLLTPANFNDQKRIFERLRSLITDKIGLLIVDTISNLYRVEAAENQIQDVNRQLGLQISYLVEIARKKNIPVIVTAQVYSSFDEKDKVNLVGGDLLKYQSKCLIELQDGASGIRRAILRKHRSLPGKKIDYKIVQKGFDSVVRKKSIKSLF